LNFPPTPISSPSQREGEEFGEESLYLLPRGNGEGKGSFTF